MLDCSAWSGRGWISRHEPMNSFVKLLPDAIDAGKIAAILPAEAICTVCRRRQRAPWVAAGFHSWPMCCGRTMHPAAVPPARKGAAR
jgi:hypothetical protein